VPYFNNMLFDVSSAKFVFPFCNPVPASAHKPGMVEVGVRFLNAKLQAVSSQKYLTKGDALYMDVTLLGWGEGERYVYLGVNQDEDLQTGGTHAKSFSVIVYDRQKKVWDTVERFNNVCGLSGNLFNSAFTVAYR
jgi:hypothetical protein